jgi:RNA polymerase sigma factor (sigma-70 family)
MLKTNALEIFQENKGLVYYQLRRMHLINDEDAENAALYGLYKAITTFDETKGCKLSTYAIKVIFSEINLYLKTQKNELKTVFYNDLAKEDCEYADVLFISADSAYSELNAAMIIKEVETAYNKLAGEGQKRVVRLWIDADFDINNTEIAKQIGVTSERVSKVLIGFKALLEGRLKRKGLM